MVSTEYPPMIGGVGRYTSNLSAALRKSGQEVIVLSSEKGDGDFKGISPTNKNNSELMLEVVKKIKPDVVHIQLEPGLYGLHLDILDSGEYKTFIDCFYNECKVPIITTFHSVYSFREWMNQVFLIKKTGKTGRFGIPARFIVKLLKNISHYNSYMDLNKKKLKQSYAGIGFSKYVSNLLGGGLNVIYHGAEPVASLIPLEQARAFFSIPFEKKVGVTVGFRTVTKGWDILNKINLPNNWVLVSNSAKSHYSKEEIKGPKNKNKNKKFIDLQRGFLSNEELSILLQSSDIILLPYKITSGSGVMFDALAHGLPFVASNLGFFKEFSEMGLGITTKRNSKSMASAITELEENYDKYSSRVQNFKKALKWDYVAEEHIKLYSKTLITNNKSKREQYNVKIVD